MASIGARGDWAVRRAVAAATEVGDFEVAGDLFPETDGAVTAVVLLGSAKLLTAPVGLLMTGATDFEEFEAEGVTTDKAPGIL